jgi:bifunctional non-homologous end joining protein LigD
MLEKYREKRDFDRTPEPLPEAGKGREGALTFVIQKHAARRLHYDVRLEVDGVLKSWAVPKGPSLDPEEKRLAVMVEDHPLDYGTFEGVIPKGEYGGGEVIVWDNGTYSPDDENRLSFYDRAEAERRMLEMIEKGKISIFFRGTKLKGSWTLVKIAKSENNEWLMIKHRDEFVDADRDVLQDEKSVISGLTVEDLAGGTPAPPQIKDPSAVKGAKKAPFPKNVEPMLAQLAEKPFDGDDWIFEPKLDGVRALATVRGDEIRLHSRRGLEMTRQYPALVQDLQSQVTREMILDGEIVALDEQGRPSFNVLQQRLNLTNDHDIRRMDVEIPVYLYIFDILYADGSDYRGSPLTERRRVLQKLLLPSKMVMPTFAFETSGHIAYEISVEHGFEGIMAKKRDSMYESGKRSRCWLKIKPTLSADFVIGGYTKGEGSRSSTLGAVLVGEHDEKGDLVYVSNVGSGFDDKFLTALKKRLDALEVEKPPFKQKPPVKDVTWVRPELVCEVKFAQRTKAGTLRAPIFMGLRDEVRPDQVQPAEVVKVEDEPVPQKAMKTKKKPEAEVEAPTTVSKEEIDSVVEQLREAKDAAKVEVGPYNIEFSNLNKAYWPAGENHPAVTKRDLAVYMARVSPWALSHLRDRPLTLRRFPEGITGQPFYQKHWEHRLPEFVEKIGLYSEHNKGDQEYLACNNLPTMLWLAQIADLELHTWMSRTVPQPDAPDTPTVFTGSLENMQASILNYPDYICFDFDPYIFAGHEKRGEEPELNQKAFQKTVQAARWLKEILDSIGLKAYPKTTGKTGLHIYVPIIRRFTFSEVRAAAETVCKFILTEHPKEVTMEWSTDKRTGKIFLDHNMNSRGKTLASIYSPRNSPVASVSMGFDWDELDDVYPTDFTVWNAPDRLAERGDRWADILENKQDLGKLIPG